ncbi:MAG: ABC transporter substrate-binding protein [Ramlibacter sp.]
MTALRVSPAPPAPRRRALLVSTAAAIAKPMAFAQPGRPAGKPVTVAQIVDTSAAQQDVSKDLLIGSRAFWQDLNARGGVRGRPVAHQAIEVDGTAASLRAAVAQVRDNGACVALSATAGDPVAEALVDVLRQENLAIAHAAPWLQTSALEVDDRTFPIFAPREGQIAHALKSLTSVGVQAIGAIYGTDADYLLHRRDVERIAAALRLKLQTFRAEGDLTRLAQTFTPGTPALLLFLGGTPELAQLMQGLDRQPRQRYLVALADVNLQVMQQLGGGRSTPVIATQVVPVVTAGLPVVRAYREALGRLFDEPPAPLSLAGFIAARYTAEVLADVDGALSRQSALAAFQRRASFDLGGFRISYDQHRRSGTFVTQSMLMPDGRVIG